MQSCQTSQSKLVQVPLLTCVQMFPMIVRHRKKLVASVITPLPTTCKPSKNGAYGVWRSSWENTPKQVPPFQAHQAMLQVIPSRQSLLLLHLQPTHRHLANLYRPMR